MDGLGPVGFSIGNDGGGGGCWSILRWRGVSLCVPWPRCAQNMMGNILKENVDIVELPLRLSLRVGALAHCLFACVQCVCATCPRCVCVHALAARGRSLARFKCVCSCFFCETCMDEEREKLFFSRDVCTMGMDERKKEVYVIFRERCLLLKEREKCMC